MRWISAAAGVLLAAAACLPVGCDWTPRRERARQHLNRGKLLVDQGQLRDALAELERAIDVAPDFEPPHTTLGDVHRRLGDHQRAVASYQTACRLAPYAFRPHYNLGVTYQLMAHAAPPGRKTRDLLAKAVHVYLRALAIRGDDFETHLNLGACYHQLGQSDLAEQYALAATRIQPHSPQAHANLGVIYAKMNRYHDAIKAYHRSLELDVEQPLLMLNLGHLYLHRRPQPMLRSALRAFELAAQRQPDNAVAWEHIALCRFRLGRHEDALKAYHRAAVLNNDSPTIHRAMGVVYMTLALLNPDHPFHRDQALSAWRRSLALNPNQPDLQRLVRKYSPPVTGPEL